MYTNTLEDKVKTLIAEHLFHRNDMIIDSNALLTDLGADSLDVVELIMAIEETFHVQFDDENVKITSVQDVIDYLSYNLSNDNKITEKTG